MTQINADTMTPRHVKAARALLGITAEELSEISEIGLATLRTFESGKDIKPASQQAIFDALTEHGVIMENGGSPGVKVTEPDKWAINLRQMDCPQCGAPLPMVRTPKNLRQLIWGGWTCQSCGTEVSKTGKPLFKRT